MLSMPNADPITISEKQEAKCGQVPGGCSPATLAELLGTDALYPLLHTVQANLLPAKQHEPATSQKGQLAL